MVSSRHLGAWGCVSGAGKGNAALSLVLASTITVGGFTSLIGLKEQHLSHTFVGVDLGRQGCCVGKLKRDVTFPLGLKRSDIDDNATPSVGALAQTDRQYVTRDAEVLDSSREGERVWWNDAHIALNIDEAFFIEVLRIDDCRMDVGEHLELIGASHIVTVAAGAVADDLFGHIKIALRFVAHLSGIEAFEHRFPIPPEVLKAGEGGEEKMFSLTNLVWL